MAKKKIQLEIELRIQLEKLQKLEKQIDEINRKFKDTGKSGSGGMKKIADDMNSASGDMEKTAKGMGAASGDMEKAAHGMHSATGGLKGAMEMMTGMAGGMLMASAVMAGISAITDGLKFMVTASLEYQDSLAELSAITGVTGDKLSELGIRARNLAKEFGGAPAAQLESFKGILSRLGPAIGDSPEALESMGRSINTLSMASGEGAAASMDVLTNAVLQFDVSLDDPIKAADEMAVMMNVIAAGAKEGAAEIPQIGRAIVVAGASAKVANVAFTETNAAVQVLAAKAGIYGAQAGTGLRNVIGFLQKASKMSRGLTDDLGLPFEKLGETLTTQGLGAALSQLKDTLDKLPSTAAKNAAVMRIFGVENAAAALALMNNTDMLGDFTEKLTGTNVAYEQAAIRQATLSVTMERLGAVVVDQILGAFTQIEPLVTAVFSNIIPIVEGAFTVFGYLAGAVEALAPALILAGVAYGGYTLVVNAATIATKVAAIATKAFNAATKASPWGMAIAGVVALVAGFKALSDAINVTAEEKLADAKVEKDLIRIKIDLNKKQQQQVKSNIELAAEYERLGKKANRTADEEKKLQEATFKLAREYPGVVSSSKSFAENLAGVKKELGLQNVEMSKLSKKNRDLIAEYEELGKKEKLSADEKKRLREVTIELNKEYPGVIESTRTFAENLDTLQNRAGLSSAALRQLEKDAVSLDKNFRQANLNIMQAEANKAKRILEDLIAEGTGNLLTDATDSILGTSTPRQNAEAFVKPFADMIYAAADSKQIDDAVVEFTKAITASDSPIPGDILADTKSKFEAFANLQLSLIKSRNTKIETTSAGGNKTILAQTEELKKILQNALKGDELKNADSVAQRIGVIKKALEQATSIGDVELAKSFNAELLTLNETAGTLGDAAAEANKKRLAQNRKFGEELAAIDKRINDRKTKSSVAAIADERQRALAAQKTSTEDAVQAVKKKIAKIKYREELSGEQKKKLETKLLADIKSINQAGLDKLAAINEKYNQKEIDDEKKKTAAKLKARAEAWKAEQQLIGANYPVEMAAFIQFQNDKLAAEQDYADRTSAVVARAALDMQDSFNTRFEYMDSLDQVAASTAKAMERASQAALRNAADLQNQYQAYADARVQTGKDRIKLTKKMKDAERKNDLIAAKNYYDKLEELGEKDKEVKEAMADAEKAITAQKAAGYGLMLAQMGLDQKNWASAAWNTSFEALKAYIPIAATEALARTIASLGFPLGPILGALAYAAVYTALSGIQATQPFEHGGLAPGALSVNAQGGLMDGGEQVVGVRFNEAGREFVVNAATTARNLSALEIINRENITIREYVHRYEPDIAGHPPTAAGIPSFAPLERRMARIENEISVMSIKVDTAAAAAMALANAAEITNNYESRITNYELRPEAMDRAKDETFSPLFHELKHVAIYSDFDRLTVSELRPAASGLQSAGSYAPDIYVRPEQANASQRINIDLTPLNNRMDNFEKLLAKRQTTKTIVDNSTKTLKMQIGSRELATVIDEANAKRVRRF